jgi:hypothetical protein
VPAVVEAVGTAAGVRTAIGTATQPTAIGAAIDIAGTTVAPLPRPAIPTMHSTMAPVIEAVGTAAGTGAFAEGAVSEVVRAAAGTGTFAAPRTTFASVTAARAAGNFAIEAAATATVAPVTEAVGAAAGTGAFAEGAVSEVVKAAASTVTLTAARAASFFAAGAAVADGAGILAKGRDLRSKKPHIIRGKCDILKGLSIPTHHPEQAHHKCPEAEK